ncbi:MAG TPA: SgcJ/EcaC family oxidoreductase [Polyangiaceae bacterium]|jgi:uncharacterized protein (TIGR02246 family)|nr:SgcJ/EcaC family oxidoreductase [Polyangiaceae bacterium]
MSGDERAIRRVIETWMAASQAGDQAKVQSLMADDVLFMVPGQAPFGKEAFAAGAQEMKETRIEAKSDIKEIGVHGSWAWCRTYLVVTMTPPNGSAVRRSGYTLSILRKKRDGAWVIARDANLLTKEWG